jgi:hypothetical protein
VSDLYSWFITSIPDYILGEIPAPGRGGGGADNALQYRPFLLIQLRWISHPVYTYILFQPLHLSMKSRLALYVLELDRTDHVK